MKFIRGIENITANKEGCVLTLGNFDGIHLGHQNILKNLKKEAQQRNLPSAVIFFEPQPREFFCKENAPARLSSLYEKYTFFKKFDIDFLYCLRFSKNLASMSCEDFVQKIIIEKFNVKHLIIGDDFCFGNNRQGNFNFLQEYANKTKSFTIEKTTSFLIQNLRVSSTLIRQSLADDDLKLARDLLGRPFSIAGKVVHGQQLGRTIGFPTANIHLKRISCPVKGVFAVNVIYNDGSYKGIANIGSRPTVKGSFPRLEVYIFDFTGNLYGKRIEVQFLHKIRNEQKFADISALKKQIKIDQENAILYFSKYPFKTSTNSQ